MSSPEKEPRHRSSLTESGHARILAGIRHRRSENPSPPREPYVPLSQERVSKILANVRTARALAAASKQEDLGPVNSDKGYERMLDDEIPSGPENLAEEPEEPESDEETRTLRRIIFHLNIPDAGPPGVPVTVARNNDTLAQWREHTKKKVQAMFDFIDARIGENEEFAEECRKGLEESQNTLAVLKKNKETFMRFVIREGLN